MIVAAGLEGFVPVEAGGVPGPVGGFFSGGFGGSVATATGLEACVCVAVGAGVVAAGGAVAVAV